MLTKKSLNNYWWFRLIKVVYIIILILSVLSLAMFYMSNMISDHMTNNFNLDVANFWLAFIIAIATAFYAFFTLRIMMQGSKGDNIKYRPYLLVKDISISAPIRNGQRYLMIDYVLKNVGLTPVFNLDTMLEIKDQNEKFIASDIGDEQTALLLVPTESKTMSNDVIINNSKNLFNGNNYNFKISIKYKDNKNNQCSLVTHLRVALSSKFKNVSELDKNIIFDWKVVKEELH